MLNLDQWNSMRLRAADSDNKWVDSESTDAPSLAIFKGRLIVAFRGVNSTDILISEGSNLRKSFGGPKISVTPEMY